MNGGTIERTKERENERTTELMNGGTIERTNDRKIRTNERQDARTNGLRHERINDQPSERRTAKERTNK